MAKIANLVDDERSLGTSALLAEEWTQFAVAQMAKMPDEVHIMATFTIKGDEPPGPQKGRKLIKAFWEKAEKVVNGMLVVEEYGGQNGRLHYHAMMRVEELHWRSWNGKWMHDFWGAGFTKFEEPRGVEAFRYTTKYIMKEVGGTVGWFEVYKRDMKPVQAVMDGVFTRFQ